MCVGNVCARGEVSPVCVGRLVCAVSVLCVCMMNKELESSQGTATLCVCAFSELC